MYSIYGLSREASAHAQKLSLIHQYHPKNFLKFVVKMFSTKTLSQIHDVF